MTRNPLPFMMLLLALALPSAPAGAQTPPATPADSAGVARDTTVTAPAAADVPAATAVTAAKPAKPPLKDRIYYGGSVTLSFGSTSTIGVYPMIAYKLTPRISTGIELGYEHLTYSGQSTDNYGGSVFGRMRIGPSLYAHAEYQTINYELFSGPNTSRREWVPFLLLGGGVARTIAPRMSVYAEVLFDVLQDKDSPYNAWDPVVNVGVGVGF